MRLPASLFTLFFSISLFSQQLNIIPQPVSVKQPKIAAKFNVNSSTQIVLKEAISKILQPISMITCTVL